MPTPLRSCISSDARPEAIELGAEKIRFVEQDSRMREQIKDSAVGSGDGSIKLPAREDRYSAGADRSFNNLFVARDALAGKTGVNGAQ